MAALWIAVGGTMTLVIVMWVLLLPMQLRGGTLIGAREISRWNVYRPQAEGVAKSWSETMDEWRALFSQGSAETEAELKIEAPLSETENDIRKLRAKIEAAGSRNDSPPASETTPSRTQPKP